LNNWSILKKLEIELRLNKKKFICSKLDLFDLSLPVVFGIFGFIWTNLLVTIIAKEFTESSETESQLARRVGLNN
jgi:hypothetical protein